MFYVGVVRTSKCLDVRLMQPDVQGLVHRWVAVDEDVLGLHSHRWFITPRVVTRVDNVGLEVSECLDVQQCFLYLG